MSLTANILAFTRTDPAFDEALATNDALGIELEYEQVTDTGPRESTYWVTAPDGSLRNQGVEFVSEPLAFENVESALTEVETIVRDTGAVATQRCGLHVHLNMRPYSIGQVWSTGCLYAIIEPTLYQTYALRRENSMFAVPMWLNSLQVNSLFRDINNIRNLRSGAMLPGCEVLGSSKYSALNFQSLARFGTLEMRQPYCTTDFEAIRSWTDFCMRLVMVGTSYFDPLEVLNWYESGSLGEIQERLFGMSVPTDDDIQELADDAAYYIAGIVEPRWETLQWDLPTLENE